MEDQGNNSTCDEAADKLLSALETQDDKAVRSVIELNPNCRETLEGTLEMWEKLGEIQAPTTSPTLKENFYASLENFEADTKIKTLSGERLLFTALKWAAVLSIGVMIGLFADQVQFGNSTGELRSEPSNLMSSLVSTSSTQRLAALQEIKGIQDPNQKIYDALFQVLTEDPNTNVRLSTIEALIHFADRSEARMMLIKALPFQDSPMVQMTLAEMIIQLKDEESIKKLREMIKTEKLDREVRFSLSQTLSTL